MPKKAKELSAKAVRDLNTKGLHAVGGVSGLFLQITSTDAKSWILRVTTGEKRTSKSGNSFYARQDIGLGGFPDVTLSMARDKARELKEQLRNGIDPLAERRSLKAAMVAERAKNVSFKDIAKEFIDKKALEYKTTKQVQKLTNMLEKYAYPTIGNMIVGDIERIHVLNVLEPIWQEKTETAKRTRMYIERILDLGGVKGLRTGDNPARWKGNLELTLAAPEKIASVEHYTALPITNLPEFMATLRQQEWLGAKALELIILTAARSGEARQAKWEEFDLNNKVWTVPAERMKGKKTHKVPLCSDAIKLLKSLHRENEYLFPNAKNGNPLTDATISKVPKRIGYQVTTHGFRSTFKDWCSEHTTYADEVSELALAHVNDDKTRAAYARSELIDKRRSLMNEWQEFINSEVKA